MLEFGTILGTLAHENIRNYKVLWGAACSQKCQKVRFYKDS